MKKDKVKRQKQQVRKQTKARRREKRQAKQPTVELRRNQIGIGKKLLAGEVPLVCATAWGFVEGFVSFMEAVGFWEVLDIEGEHFERKMVSVCQLLATYELKVLLGIVSINQEGVKLFREVALLRLIGYTTQQLSEGLCKRGYGDHKPMHGSTLTSALARLTERELDWLLQGTIRRLVKRQLLWLSNGHYALDASDLETSAKFKGGGRKTTTERKRSREGEWVEVLKTVHGLKLLIIYEVKLRLVVAAKIVPIQQHESLFTLELVRQAQRNLGAGYPIRVLLIDWGFLDGETLWTLKHDLDIDWVIPARSDMDATTDARQLAQQPIDHIYITGASRPATGLKGRGQVSVRGVFDLSTFSTYGDAAHQQTRHRQDFKPNPVNALVVTRWRDKPYPFNPGTGVNAFHTQRGQALAHNGIRRQRAHDFAGLPIMVIDDASHTFALFHIEELLTLLGHPPTICLTIQPDQVLQSYAA